MINPKILKIFRWLGRIWAGFFLLLFSFILLGHILTDSDEVQFLMSAKERLTFAFFPVLALIGLFISLFQHLIGGYILFLSYFGLLFSRSDLASNEYILAGVLMPALLNLTYWYLTKRKSK